MTTWFTSDLHFNHAKIMEYCPERARLFDGVEAMNDGLIEAWNSVVHHDDQVWVIGDFALGAKEDQIEAILSRLRGHKHLILGNHDKKSIMTSLLGKDLWASVQSEKLLEIEGQYIYLRHYKQSQWPFSDAPNPSWMLWGHAHGSEPSYGLSFDVGVDAVGIHPISFEQVKARMASLAINVAMESIKNRIQAVLDNSNHPFAVHYRGSTVHVKPFTEDKHEVWIVTSDDIPRCVATPIDFINETIGVSMMDHIFVIDVIPQTAAKGYATTIEKEMKNMSSE